MAQNGAKKKKNLLAAKQSIRGILALTAGINIQI
jgi:hypothetical protein